MNRLWCKFLFFLCTPIYLFGQSSTYSTTLDVDGDLLEFVIYLDENDASTLYSTLEYQTEEESIEVEVKNNTTYYWKIIAIDNNKNQSSSGVYAFRTN